MPDLIWPIKWLIELILVSFHQVFTFLGMQSSSGATWVLSIVGLVMVVRASLIPVFVKQIVSQRNMLVLQPELQKLQKKYKGRNDPDSRREFAEAQMALYKKHNTNPIASCLPLLIQMPIFTGLYFVLSEAANGKTGVGLLSKELADSFASSVLFGAPIKLSFMTAGSNLTVQIMAAVMVVLMTASQFITQRQILAKNQNPAAMNSQYMQTQKIMMYIFPIMFLFTGVSFSLALVFYWLTSNIWTMGQQYIVIRNMPTPGSPAYAAWEKRQEKKASRKPMNDSLLAAETAIENALEAPVKTQRDQPVSKNRAKKKR